MKRFVNKKSIKNFSLALSLTLCVSSYPYTNVFGANQDDIIIYHTNDMHGNVENLASVKTLKDNTENALLIDAGDATQGSSLATYTKGQAIIDIMNATGYDVATLGNHEFDFGSEKAVENMKRAKFTPISANVVDSNQNLLLNGINGNGANVIEEVNGKRIGIFGLTTEETYYKTNPKNLNGTEFKSVIETAKNQVELLKAEDVDAIVAVVHIGDDKSSSPTSLDLAKEVDGIDLIIDGHSHTIIQQKVNDTTVVQTGTALESLGKVTLSFENDHINIKNELLNMETIVKENPANEEVTKIYNSYSEQVDKELEKVIGNTKSDLYANAEDAEGTRLSRIEETPMGDLIADSMVYSTKKLLENTEYKNHPVVALENGGGVRANIKAGDITLGDVFNVLPFGNIISVKVITPDVLYNALENGVSKMEIDENGQVTGLDGRFPQISGMRIEIDPTKTAFNSENPDASTGERVSAIYLVDENGNETLLDRKDNKTEIVLASNDFVIAGGDGYTALSNLKHIAEGEVLDVVLADYITYLTEQQGGSFTYNMPGNRTQVVTNENNDKKEFKPISLNNFLYLSEDKEVTLYNDVPETEPPYWANESIYYFKALGIFEDSDNFYPNNNVTYGQFKTILQKLLGLENNNLEEYGIISNNFNKTYNDNDILAREDVALMVGNVIKAYGIELESKSITINDNISDFAKDNFQFLAEIGVLKGDGKSFNPEKPVTKAELSVILYNLTELYSE